MQTMSSVAHRREHQTATRGAAEAALALAEKVAKDAMAAAYNEAFRKWTGISHPDFHTTDVENCRIVLSFDVAKRKKAMGGVTEILSVVVDNAKQQLTVKYLERPSIRNATDVRRASSWLKRKLAVDSKEEVVPVSETIEVPSACMADEYSRYFVVKRSKKQGTQRVFAAIVELAFHPGSFVVPRDIAKRSQLDLILRQLQHKQITEGLWEMMPGCMMFIRVQSQLRGAPRVAINPSRGTVEFRGEEVKGVGSKALPKECTWDDPNSVSVMTRHNRTVGSDMWDVLLFMTNAPSETRKEYELPKAAEVERREELTQLSSLDESVQDNDMKVGASPVLAN
ncbi:conserved hypothetical protein [Neospora caninum Liverpool]|nr:conserved hypothetical protein [Neospora caninum Liverpool]CBZ51745.1 conserved hypothetical protein [Neospora caninum Liverpool]|eukprot:XP_003881778.1 conserved hypothetical protein [Neospora caninum Liverpool]